MLRERIRCTPMYAEEEGILRIANRDVPGWTTAVEDFISQTGIERLVLPNPLPNKNGTRAKFRKYKKDEVMPRVQEWEATRWLNTPKQRLFAERVLKVSWTVATLAVTICSMRKLRQWAQQERLDLEDLPL